jgi:hypothetical protein
MVHPLGCLLKVTERERGRGPGIEPQDERRAFGGGRIDQRLVDRHVPSAASRGIEKQACVHARVVGKGAGARFA